MSGTRRSEVRSTSLVEVVGPSGRRNGVAPHADATKGVVSVSPPRWTPVLKQIEFLRAENARCGWGYTERDFRRLPAEESEWPRSPFIAHVVVPYFGTVERTAQELFRLISGDQRISSIKALTFERQCPYLHASTIHPGHTMRVETINFAAYWNQELGSVPDDVSESCALPNAGIFAALAVHRTMAIRMNGETDPFLWIPGYRINYFGEEEILYVDRRNGNLHVRVGRPYERCPGYAVPMFHVIPQ